MIESGIPLLRWVRKTSIRALPHQPIQDVFYLPRTVKHCVYYVVRNGEVLLVGRTVNLWGRWNRYDTQHKLDELVELDTNKGGVDLYWRELKPYQIKFVEAWDIWFLKPKLNQRMESLSAGVNFGMLRDWLGDFVWLFGSGLLLALALALV